ncbi:MAG: hypothetical protein K8H86_07345 [Ignavibacteriaceae bacterium]|nr:hypothetical protein [Ignavibacteriaceae bacterium]
MIKKLVLIFLLSVQYLLAGGLSESRARGLFFAFGVGPRLPMSAFAKSSDMGYGIDFELSYTDNEFLPVFLFAKAGYSVYPGSQSFYQTTDYSTYSTTSIPINAGVRYYFKPMMENIVLFMPIVELSASYCFFSKLHEFKPTALRSNYIEDNAKFGVSAGAGISMFMMEILASYNYYQTNQYVSLDLKVRLPLYIIF